MPGQAHLQGTQSPHTKANPESFRDKRACLVPTLPGHTLRRRTHTFSSTQQDEGLTYNKAVWQYGGWMLLASAFYRYQQRLRQT